MPDSQSLIQFVVKQLSGDILPDGYVFDRRVNRYRNNRTGQFVARRTIYLLLNANEAGSLDTMFALSRQLAEGEIPIQAWFLAVRQQLIRLHVQNAALGAGGFDAIRPSDFARIDHYLAEDLERLARFGEEIAAGRQSLAQIANRLNMYAGRARINFYRAQPPPVADPGHVYLERRVLRPAEHCGYCVHLSQLGWQPVGVLPMPGESSPDWDGDQCYTNCRCDLERRQFPIEVAHQMLGDSLRNAPRARSIWGRPESARRYNPSQPRWPAGTPVDPETGAGGGRFRPADAGPGDGGAGAGDDGAGAGETSAEGAGAKLQSGISVEREGAANREMPAEVDTPEIMRVFSLYHDMVGGREVELSEQIQAVKNDLEAMVADGGGVDEEKLMASTQKLAELIEEMEGLRNEYRQAVIEQVLAVDDPLDVPFASWHTVGFPERVSLQELEQWVEIGKQLVSKGVIRPDAKLSVYGTAFDSRSYYDLQNGEIYVAAADAGLGTYIHEFGHWIEENSDLAKQNAMRFYRWRTQGENPVPLSELTGLPYPDSESARPDRFVDPYMGKLYLDDNGEPMATEIISTGLEKMVMAPHVIAVEDPEMFMMLYRTLRGEKWEPPS